MSIFTKGMGAIMKSKMRKAFVDKPTFPGPNTMNILNRELKKRRKTRGPGFRGQDVVESAARMRKGKPGKSFIEIDARIKREAIRDFAKDAKMPKEYKKVK
tara:strand:+ start:206 stop:508 length:303 start_codon:yes stop_codon:yes gene_type:complete